MDWNSYLIVSAALFGIFVTLLTVRFFVGKDLEKLETKRQMEEGARQTAESNPGL